MRDSLQPLEPSLPTWAKISLGAVLLYVIAAAGLTFLIHQPPTGHDRREVMIEKLDGVETGFRELEQASASLPPVSLVGQDRSMKQWAGLLLNYRRKVDTLSADSKLVDYEEIKENMLRAYSLESRSEQIRKDIIRNNYTAEQAKGLEAEYRATITLAMAEVNAAKQKLRMPSEQASRFPRIVVTIFLLASLVLASALVALLLIQPTREGERHRLQQTLSVSQRSLQECENRSLAVFQSTLDGLVLMDEKGYIQQFSPSAEKLFGISSVDVIGQSIFKLLPGTDRGRIEEQIRKLTPTRDLGATELIIHRPDGSEQKLELILRKSTEGRMIIALFRDRSQTSSGEAQLRQDIGFLASILDAARSFLVILDRQGRILRCNRASEVLAGRPSPELRGRHFADIFTPRRADAVKAAYQKVDEASMPEKLEEICPSGVGERVITWTNALLRDAEGKPEFVVVTGADITELRRQAVAPAAVSSTGHDDLGRFSGELAFNLGNLLTNVSGYADLVLATMVPEDPSFVDVQQIKDSGDRAASLVHKLLGFAGRNAARPKMIDLNATLAAVARQQVGRLGDHVQLHLELAQQAPHVVADSAQLAEIVGLLFDNAREAMPTGGQAALRTAVLEGEGENATFASISVADSGRGLRKDEAARIFEPFFTTKEPGKGSGLSLASVRGMLEQVGGSIRAYGEPGKGTTVEILLPMASRARGPVLVEKAAARR